MYLLSTTSCSCVKWRQFTVKGAYYHVISVMFVNMRQPHVILAMRKDFLAARPIRSRGSVRGGAPALRYGKSLGDTLYQTCAPRLLIATLRLKAEPSGVTMKGRPGQSDAGRGRCFSVTEGKIGFRQTRKLLMLLHGQGHIMLRMLRREYHHVIHNHWRAG